MRKTGEIRICSLWRKFVEMALAPKRLFDRSRHAPQIRPSANKSAADGCGCTQIRSWTQALSAFICDHLRLVPSMTNCTSARDRVCCASCRNFLAAALDELGEGHLALIPSSAGSDGDPARGRFLLTNNEHVGHFLQGCCSNFGADFFRAEVHIHPHAFGL